MVNMHIVANIRNIDKLLLAFPELADTQIDVSALARRYSAGQLRARHHDLVIARVVRQGATSTENRDGSQRELVEGEWMIVPVVERESSLSHGSVVPKDGISIGATVDYICRGGGVGVSADNPPGQGNPTKVEIMGILQYDDKRVANAREFAVKLRASDVIKPVIAVVGSKSDCGKTTLCTDLIQLLHRNGYRVGVCKLSGTARFGELLQLATHANGWLDTADAGLPTTYCPTTCPTEEAASACRHAVTAASQIVQDLSVDNDIIVAEFGGDLLAACVPEILAEPARLNIVALVMAIDSATAGIGMETKLHKISAVYRGTPQYVVGPVANLQANKNRVRRETACDGCYDLWNRTCPSATTKQIDVSLEDTQELMRKLLAHCGYANASVTL